MVPCSNLELIMANLFMKSLVLFLGFCSILLIVSCSESVSTLEDLFETDRAFSKLSEETSIEEAFLIYAADNAVILRDNQMPIIGKADISNSFEGLSGDVVLTWEPLAGEISKSGDLGYTYGIYEFKKDTSVSKGTYVSIWKKQRDGSWRYVLDTGNEGLGE